MSELIVGAYDGDRMVHGAIWPDGPKVGTKWMVTEGRHHLIRRARRGEKHIGCWIIVQP
jgi:hypothetical protein